VFEGIDFARLGVEQAAVEFPQLQEVEPAQERQAETGRRPIGTLQRAQPSSGTWFPRRSSCTVGGICPDGAKLTVLLSGICLRKQAHLYDSVGMHWLTRELATYVPRSVFPFEQIIPSTTS
jgi:hypothetical protein